MFVMTCSKTARDQAKLLIYYKNAIFCRKPAKSTLLLNRRKSHFPIIKLLIGIVTFNIVTMMSESLSLSLFTLNKLYE